MANTSASNVRRTKQERRATFSWALWDWAEQPYPTLMQTFVFPVYLTGTVAAGIQSPDVWMGWATAIAGVVLALIAPVLGRRSDLGGKRKRWLVINTLTLAIITALSFFVEPKAEFFLFGLALYAIGSVVQESAFINYYAMLKQVTTEKTLGRISGYAWSLGYIGGIILLLVSLVGFILPSISEPAGTIWFGIANEAALPTRAVFVFSALWIIAFSIPLMLWVPETEKRPGAKAESIVQSYRNTVRDLLGMRKNHREAYKFLVASAVYRDGLSGVFTFGAVLGTLAFGFDQSSIIFYGIGANILAGVGAAIGGRLDDIFGSRTIIMASLVGLIASGLALFAFSGLGQLDYWIFGLLLSLFVGPAQASSRSFVSRFTPIGREGEVFGLYQLTGRAVSFLSGTMWAISISTAIAFGVLQDKATIYGIFGLLAILALGLVMLSRVHPKPSMDA